MSRYPSQYPPQPPQGGQYGNYNARQQSTPPPPPAYGQSGMYASEGGDVTVSGFFNIVYAWMAVGLAVTAVVAYVFSQNASLMAAVYGSKGGYLVFGLGAFAIAWYVQSQMGRLSVGVATTLFMVYAAVIGALISGIFVIYRADTLVSALALTGGTFGAMSVYGFVTKRDLSGIGAIAMMAVLGLFIASIVNIFLASSALSWVITYAVLVLFIVITAYETQMLKGMAEQLRYDPAMARRVAVVGSLMLYISFINLFLSILRILGDRR